MSQNIWEKQPSKDLTGRFRPHMERVREYLSINDDSRSLKKTGSILIPLGKNDWMEFVNGFSPWRADRSKKEYDQSVFSDHDQPIFGGKESAFAPGKVVLDLGSGEARALLQYSLDFPETSFIGIDSGYQKKNEIEMGVPGVQLTKDSWNELDSFERESVDTIITCQAAFRWGIQGGNDEGLNSDNLMWSVTRVAKPGAILRFDYEANEKEYFEELLKKFGWEVKFAERTVIARKRK